MLNNYTVSNGGSAPVNGWTVHLGFNQPVTITNAWGVVLHAQSGSLLSGSNVGYNGSIAPGQSVTFGMQGAPGSIGTPTCTAE